MGILEEAVFLRLSNFSQRYFILLHFDFQPQRWNGSGMVFLGKYQKPFKWDTKLLWRCEMVSSWWKVSYWKNRHNFDVSSFFRFWSNLACIEEYKKKEEEKLGIGLQLSNIPNPVISKEEIMLELANIPAPGWCYNCICDMNQQHNIFSFYLFCWTPDLALKLGVYSVFVLSQEQQQEPSTKSTRRK